MSPAGPHRVLVLAALAWLTVLAVPAGAGRSFTIDRLDVVADLRPDGSMAVVERLTYTFDGVYNVGDRDIPPGRYYQVVDMRASENGQPRAVLNPDPSSFEWDLGGASGTHTYELSYTVVGAAQVGPDVGELEWKWIGDDFPAVGALDVELTVPGDGEGVRAWGHGPLDGQVSIDGRTVRFTADDVAAETFVEGRVAVPASAFSVAPEGDERLPTILEEERQRVDEANARRLRIRVLSYASVVAPLAGLAGAYAVWRRWGKEPPPPPDVGEYWREVPEDPPAVGMANLGFGSVGTDAFSATVVDLAQRGHLGITEERRDRLIGRDAVDYRFERRDGGGDPLTGYERQLLDRLFATGPVTTQSEVVDRAKADRAEASRFWKSFQGQVRDDLRRRGYLSGGRARPYLWLALVIALVEGVGVLALAVGSLFGILPLVGGAALLVFVPLIRQRTREGARRAAEWRALERFLRDFSRLEEAPVGHLTLWERYLVYAVALGVSEQLVAGLRLRVPQVAQDPSFAPWYVGSHLSGDGHGDGLGGLASIGSFASGLGSATSAAFSPPSSSSGGGGGFSGGGGGGGGGGGAGAH